MEFTFKGGWVFTHCIIPGKPLKFINGEDDSSLTGITITINPYDGLW